MRAIQVSAPGGEFELVERKMPEPAGGQVRVKVIACGVCRGDDIVKEGGHYPGLSYPRIPGHEIVGVIDKPGPGVSDHQIGQRVGVGWPAGITYDGGFAEYMVTSTDELVVIPDELNAMEAAPLLCAGVTTFDALQNSGAQPGDMVAVQGIGGLGHLAIQYAHKMGYRTVAISRGADKKDLAEKLGAQVYIDAANESVSKALQNLGSAKVILATAPNNQAISELVDGLGMDGKLMILAGIDGPVQLSASQMFGRRSIQGWLPIHFDLKKEAISFSLLRNVRPMIEAFPLEQVDLAYEKMLNSKVRFRAVLTMG
jgi:alcohol dehydrogenase, propanol-preferring